MADPKFIDAVVKATGRKQRVPASWQGTPLWESFRLPPSASRNTPKPESDPAPVKDEKPAKG